MFKNGSVRHDAALWTTCGGHSGAACASYDYESAYRKNSLPRVPIFIGRTFRGLSAGCATLD